MLLINVFELQPSDILILFKKRLILDKDKLNEAAELISKAEHITAFTGAGISVESGIPPFRGKNGLWSKYDPIFLSLDYFYENSTESWKLIKEIFYDFFGQALPNYAHKGLAELEKFGKLEAVITQNIDNLHQEAGSLNVIEFHGTSRILACTQCSFKYQHKEISLVNLPPICPRCGSVLKPNFIFFGEGIPQHAYLASMFEAENADLFIIIGTTGEVMPASLIPQIAKQNGAKILEINTEPSNYTHELTDVFLQGKASMIMKQLVSLLDRD